ncbi:dihydroorotate dehydrogenase-like protein [Bacteroidota bacterium]
MNLSTTYMGLPIKNPIVISSSKLTDNVQSIKQLADHGAGAIVLKSLFEEQFLADTNKLIDKDDKYFWFPESIDFINRHAKEFGLKEYKQLISEAKRLTDVPIIGSINCISPHEWPRFAKDLEDAGVDGLELNISIFPTDAEMYSEDIENNYLEIVKAVKLYTSVPVSVKIGSYFTNIHRMVAKLWEAGADAVVLFNRYYRPDINIEDQSISAESYISGPEEMTKSLRWITLLSEKTSCELVANTGIHCGDAVVKQLLAGANATQICSTLMKNGIGYIETILDDLTDWMSRNKYESISDFKGKFSKKESNLAAFERLQFMKRSYTNEYSNS